MLIRRVALQRPLRPRNLYNLKAARSTQSMSTHPRQNATLLVHTSVEAIMTCVGACAAL
ncbi:hypothetical protein RR48_08592 [Papilio machaon]|uniref:Uncharacterized protein n=1 Tax=Papilio machaon TaxID=76193 RepID=A0A194RN30_PAPMA|nr:hypothetical protein RR48_08592 [Papilio machaon]